MEQKVRSSWSEPELEEQATQRVRPNLKSVEENKDRYRPNDNIFYRVYLYDKKNGWKQVFFIYNLLKVNMSNLCRI